MITEAKGNYGVALTFLTTFHGEMGEDRRISTQESGHLFQVPQPRYQSPFDADIYDRCVEEVVSPLVET